MHRWSIDLAFPTDRVALELDGEYWHSLPGIAEKDARKDDWLAQAGWTVVRVVMTKNESAADVAAHALEALAPWIQT